MHAGQWASTRQNQNSYFVKDADLSASAELTVVGTGTYNGVKQDFRRS